MRYIIDFVNTALNASIDSYLAANNITVLKTFDNLGKVYSVESASVPPSNAVIESIINDEANPIQLLGYTAAPGDAFPKVTFPSTEWWKMATFRKPVTANTTQTYDRRGETATIYLVDSGIKKTHPEFANADVVDLFSFNGDFTDVNGHGTALASVMVGATCGVTNATVKSVKIFQTGVNTLQSDILAALDAIISDVAANPGKFPIVNMSWNIAKNTYIEQKITMMQQNGIIVVVAAGNDGGVITDATPASLSCVTTVGAYDQAFKPCDFTNYTGPISTTPGAVNGGALDIWAPGIGINAALLDGTIAAIAGTSVAAAIESAVLAYNSFSSVLSDGSPVDIAVSASSFAYVEASAKDNILLLGDAYANSVNKVASFCAEYSGTGGDVISIAKDFVTAVRSGEKVWRRIFPTLSVSSFTLDSPLPSGFVIDNGWLVGLINTNQPFYWESGYTATKRESPSSPVSGTIQLVILPVGYDASQLPDGSPIKNAWTVGMSPLGVGNPVVLIKALFVNSK